jgi:hypothetical protein
VVSLAGGSPGARRLRVLSKPHAWTPQEGRHVPRRRGTNRRSMDSSRAAPRSPRGGWRAMLFCTAARARSRRSNQSRLEEWTAGGVTFQASACCHRRRLCHDGRILVSPAASPDHRSTDRRGRDLRPDRALKPRRRWRWRRRRAGHGRLGAGQRKVPDQPAACRASHCRIRCRSAPDILGSTDGTTDPADPTASLRARHWSEPRAPALVDRTLTSGQVLCSSRGA